MLAPAALVADALVADALVADALALRRSHPAVPALDVLELVMQGRAGAPADFGTDGLPPAEFALLVAEAFDRGMTPAEWRAWTALDADAKLRDALVVVWLADVWPLFVARFGLVP